jgi:hypothetical protein
MDEHDRLLKFLKEVNACSEVIKWVKDNKLVMEDAWQLCNRLDWLVDAICILTVLYKIYPLQKSIEYILDEYDEIIEEFLDDLPTSNLDAHLRLLVDYDIITEYDSLSIQHDRNTTKYLGVFNLVYTLYNSLVAISKDKSSGEYENLYYILLNIYKIKFNLISTYNIETTPEISKLLERLKEKFTCPDLSTIIK